MLKEKNHHAAEVMWFLYLTLTAKDGWMLNQIGDFTLVLFSTAATVYLETQPGIGSSLDFLS